MGGSVENRYVSMRKRLDASGYREAFGIESLPLVEHLFLDLIKTTENLRQYTEEATAYKKIAKELEEGVEPFREENLRLIKENSQLRLAIQRNEETLDEKLQGTRSKLRDLDSENAELKLLITQFVERVKKQEIESLEKTRRMAQLQERNLQTNIIMTDGSKKNFLIQRQLMEIDDPAPKLCPHCTRIRNFVQTGKNRDLTAIDYIKVADSRIEALTLQNRSLRTAQQDLMELFKSMKVGIEMREAELEKLKLDIKLGVHGGSEEIIGSGDHSIENFPGRDIRLTLKSAQLQLQILQKRNLELERKLQNNLLHGHDEFMLNRSKSAAERRLITSLLDMDSQCMFMPGDNTPMEDKLRLLEAQMSHCCQEKAKLKALLEDCERKHGKRKTTPDRDIPGSPPLAEKPPKALEDNLSRKASTVLSSSTLSKQSKTSKAQPFYKHPPSVIGGKKLNGFSSVKTKEISKLKEKERTKSVGKISTVKLPVHGKKPKHGSLEGNSGLGEEVDSLKPDSDINAYSEDKITSLRSLNGVKRGHQQPLKPGAFKSSSIKSKMNMHDRSDNQSRPKKSGSFTVPKSDNTDKSEESNNFRGKVNGLYKQKSTDYSLQSESEEESFDDEPTRGSDSEESETQNDNNIPYNIPAENGEIRKSLRPNRKNSKSKLSDLKAEVPKSYSKIQDPHGSEQEKKSKKDPFQNQPFQNGRKSPVREVEDDESSMNEDASGDEEFEGSRNSQNRENLKAQAAGSRMSNTSNPRNRRDKEAAQSRHSSSNTLAPKEDKHRSKQTAVGKTRLPFSSKDVRSQSLKSSSHPKNNVDRTDHNRKPKGKIMSGLDLNAESAEEEAFDENTADEGEDVSNAIDNAGKRYQGHPTSSKKSSGYKKNQSHHSPNSEEDSSKSENEEDSTTHKRDNDRSIRTASTLPSKRIEKAKSSSQDALKLRKPDTKNADTTKIKDSRNPQQGGIPENSRSTKDRDGSRSRTIPKAQKQKLLKQRSTSEENFPQLEDRSSTADNEHPVQEYSMSHSDEDPTASTSQSAVKFGKPSNQRADAESTQVPRKSSKQSRNRSRSKSKEPDYPDDMEKERHGTAETDANNQPKKSKSLGRRSITDDFPRTQQPTTGLERKRKQLSQGETGERESAYSSGLSPTRDQDQEERSSYPTRKQDRSDGAGSRTSSKDRFLDKKSDDKRTAGKSKTRDEVKSEDLPKEIRRKSDEASDDDDALDNSDEYDLYPPRGAPSDGKSKKSSASLLPAKPSAKDATVNKCKESLKNIPPPASQSKIREKEKGYMPGDLNQERTKDNRQSSPYKARSSHRDDDRSDAAARDPSGFPYGVPSQHDQRQQHDPYKRAPNPELMGSALDVSNPTTRYPGSQETGAKGAWKNVVGIALKSVAPGSKDRPLPLSGGEMDSRARKPDPVSGSGRQDYLPYGLNEERGGPEEDYYRDPRLKDSRRMQPTPASEPGRPGGYGPFASVPTAGPRADNSNEVNELYNRIRGLERIIDKIQVEADLAKASKGDLEREVQKLRRALMECQEHGQQLRSENQKTKIVLEQTEALLKDTQRKAAANYVPTQRENQELNQQVRQLMAREMVMEREVAELTSTIKALDRDKDEMRVELDRKDEKLARIQSENSKYFEQVSKLQLQLKNAELQIGHTGEASRDQEREILQLKRHIDTLKSDLDSRIKERDTVQRELQRVSQSSSKVEVERRNMSAELDKRGKESDELRKQLQKYIDEVRRIEDLLFKKEEELELLIESYSALSQERGTLESQRSVLEREATAGRSDARDAFDSNALLASKLTSQQNMVQIYEEEISKLSSQVSTLENQLRGSSDREKLLQIDVNAARDLCLKLETKLDSMRLELANAESAKNKLQADNSELRSNYEILELQLKSDEENQNKLENLLAKMRENEYQAQQVIAGTTSDKDMLTNRVSTLQNRTEQLTVEIEKYRMKSAELQSELEKVKRQYQSEKIERETALAELKRIQAQLSTSSTSLLMTSALAPSRTPSPSPYQPTFSGSSLLHTDVSPVAHPSPEQQSRDTLIPSPVTELP